MILCCGEALIDMLPRETREGAHAFAPHIGGSVFNSAIALGRLGVPVGFYSGLSTDLFGKKLGNALRWDPRSRPLKVNKRNFLLKIIALCATERLTMNEVCDILYHVCGIFEADVETVRKAWTRAGLHEMLPEKEKES